MNWAYFLPLKRRKNLDVRTLVPAGLICCFRLPRFFFSLTLPAVRVGACVCAAEEFESFLPSLVIKSPGYFSLDGTSSVDSLLPSNGSLSQPVNFSK